MNSLQSRRDFATALSLVGATALSGSAPALADEGPPETTTLRLRRDPSICVAPWYVAEGLLRAEGFTDIRYVPVRSGAEMTQAFAGGEIDFGLYLAAAAVLRLDAGLPISVLAGVHVGCYELFAHEPIRKVTELKGKKVVIETLTSAKHAYVAIMAANVGLDPYRDIEWIEDDTPNAVELFANNRVDAFLAFPPEPQELRARKLGQVILNTTIDKPWSQYFCCMLIGNRDFVRSHPIATKRALRAILKANDVCAAEPERSARRLVEGGFTGRYDYALQTLTELPYGRWREYDAEDALRFYALRLHELGMIKANPTQLIAEGSDWSFLQELKRELKT